MTSAAPFRSSRLQLPAAKRKPLHLVGSSKIINLKGRRADKLARQAQGWQDEAWIYYDEVPEVKSSVRHFGWAMGKLKLGVAWDDPAEDSDPIPVYDEDGDLIEVDGLTPQLAEAAVRELARLNVGADGGIPALLTRMNLNFEVPGECFLIGYGERPADLLDLEDHGEPERWEIRSVDEVTWSDGRWFVRDDPNQKREAQRQLDGDLDTMMRLWVEHPRYLALPDSPMRSALADCRALVGLSNEIISETNSQAAAGILLIPNEIDDGSHDANWEEGDDEDPFMTELEAALIEPIIDPESPRAIAPIAMRGPAEALEQVRHIQLGRDRSESLDERVEARIRRLARGMNMPVEVVEGLQSTTFANAEVIDQDKWDDFYEPRARLIDTLLSTAYLRPNLIDAGHDPDAVAKIRVWGDGTELIGEPDVEKNATGAHAALAISDAALRRAQGFTEADAPDEDELLRRIGTRTTPGVGPVTAILQATVADEVGVELGPSDAEVLAEAGEAPDAVEPEGEPITASAAEALADLLVEAGTLPDSIMDYPNRYNGMTAAATRPNEYGRTLVDIDRDLRSRLTQAADGYVTRALDKAGSRLRTNRAVRDVVAASVPVREIAPTLGPALIASIVANPESLTAGAFDGFEAEFRAWTTAAFEAALDVINDAAPMTDEEHDSRVAEFVDGLDEGWAQMVEELDALIDARMVDPVVAAVGEADPTSIVQTGLVRRVLSILGGRQVSIEASGDGGLGMVLTSAGQPAGGVATGGLARNALNAGGATLSGFRWTYGPGLRQAPFEPHRRLDGVTFTNFDDPVLSNREPWPPLAYFIPGDHSGCKCDFEPIILPGPT